MRTAEDFLDFEVNSSDLGKTTVREYLKTLLITLWREGEGFSGKRPWGNSGWENDLYEAACGFDSKYGVIKRDDYGDLLELSPNHHADKLIVDSISLL